MKLRILAFTFFYLPLLASSQDKQSNNTDSLQAGMDSVKELGNIIYQHRYDSSTRINAKTYINLLAKDLKDEFTKPFHMKGKDWRNLAIYSTIGGALSFFDGNIQREAVSLMNRNPNVRNFSKTVTDMGGSYEAVGLAAFGAVGLVTKNQKMQTTTLLATQAYITGTALASVVKYIAGRTRPSAYPDDVRARATFLGPFSHQNGKDNKSFPSGHTTVAFAAATVFAVEYSKTPIIPIIAYSSATLIGLSRITENEHWATDVFAGAVIGFLAGKNIVKNYHRHARTKDREKHMAKPVSFNMQYLNGRLIPGLTYRF